MAIRVIASTQSFSTTTPSVPTTTILYRLTMGRLLTPFVLLLNIAVTMGLDTTLTAAQTLLPPSNDVPEEILQVQTPLQFNAQHSGRPLSPSAYAQEQQQLRIAPKDVPAQLAPEVQQAVELLRIRKVLKVFLPFL